MKSVFEKFFSEEELNQTAKACGLTQRKSPITGFAFTLAFTTGLLNTPEGTLAQLAAFLSSACGTPVSPQAIDSRINEAAMACMHCCLEKAFEMVNRPSPRELDAGLLKDFAHVYIADSTNFELHPSLRDVFGGSKGAASPAAMRIQLFYDYISGHIHVRIGDTKMCDAPTLQQVVQGDSLDLGDRSLFLSDLGYFKIATFKDIHSKGHAFVTKLAFGVALLTEQGDRLDLRKLLSTAPASFEMRVVFDGVMFRLTGQKLPDHIVNQRLRKAARSAERKRGTQISDAYRLFLQYALFLTNLADAFTPSQLFEIYRVRWQIELIFKTWKSILKIHKIRSARLPRTMCQVYGKLIIAALTTQFSGSIAALTPTRPAVVISYHRIMQHLQTVALQLSAAIWANGAKLARFIKALARDIRRLCPKKHQKSKPSIEARLAQATAQSSPVLIQPI